MNEPPAFALQVVSKLSHIELYTILAEFQYLEDHGDIDDGLLRDIAGRIENYTGLNGMTDVFNAACRVLAERAILENEKFFRKLQGEIYERNNTIIEKDEELQEPDVMPSLRSSGML